MPKGLPERMATRRAHQAPDWWPDWRMAGGPTADRPDHRGGRQRAVDGLGPRLHRAFERFARTVFRLWVTLDVEGREHLPARPFLLCSNHASHLDGVALMVASGLPFDGFRLLAAADYSAPGSPAGRLTRAVLRIVPVDREGHAARLRQTVSECRAVVQARGRLIAFPEGTRSLDGTLLPFKRGAAFLAAELGVPVVPAAIAGTRQAMPKGRWIPRPGRVLVRFGPPIQPEEWVGTPGTRHGRAYVARELEGRIRCLSTGMATPRRP
ncbi:MAG: lysophospholipid acyltransferase family protein [Vicinamibacterales bacterium]